MSDATPASADASPFALIETLKRAAAVLREANVRFALAGGGAAYAHGASLPMHDIDFVILEEDVEKAARAFEDGGMRVERPPEGWLIKAFEDNRMIDLIFRPSGHPDMRALLDRAEEISVAATPMPVLTPTDLVISWLSAFSEHHADFAGTLTCVRPLREQVDWATVRERTSESAFAKAFLMLLSELRVLTEVEET
jgi:predicted Fe-Mo cluster-binding NifX family protein